MCKLTPTPAQTVETPAPHFSCIDPITLGSHNDGYDLVLFSRIWRCNKQDCNRPMFDLQKTCNALLSAALLAVVAVPAPVAAQGWQWPWQSNPQNVAPPAPIPSQPLARPPGPQGPGSPGGYTGGYQGAGPGPARPYQGSAQGGICVQLEERLKFESQRGSQASSALPKLDQELRLADQAARQAQAQLDRSDCFEYFLFSKTLKSNNPTCKAANNQLEGAKRRVGELDAQRQQVMASSGRSFQDDIVRELARNNCGAKWTQQANSGGGSSIWQDEDTGGSGGQFSRVTGTYRTLCVRTCDGYYFPISFSTLPENFDRDAEACQSKCAAPVELYYHPTPAIIPSATGSTNVSTTGGPNGTGGGGTPTPGVDQAVSHKTKQLYSTLKVAFLYRNKFLPGCSCKQSEYLPSGGTERRAEVTPGSPAAAVPVVPKR
jgi:hypothetical protein